MLQSVEVGMRPFKPPPTGKRAAIIGSGPAGLACAGDLAKAGVDVTVFEALHVAGGVLKYGIPEFRLPNEIIDAELEGLKKLGVKILLDQVVGKLFSVPDLLGKMGFHSVFLGTGAGMPTFMGIDGEALNGVFSANEFSNSSQSNARLRTATLRHTGGNGPPRGGHRSRQHRHGRSPGGAAHGSRNGTHRLPPQ